MSRRAKLSPEDAATVRALKEMRDADFARAAARYANLTEEEKQHVREESEKNAAALAEFKERWAAGEYD